jgi:hypothetical protein
MGKCLEEAGHRHTDARLHCRLSCRTNDSWRATPMTYMVYGRQYIAGMDGQVLWAFALNRN